MSGRIAAGTWTPLFRRQGDALNPHQTIHRLSGIASQKVPLCTRSGYFALHGSATTRPSARAAHAAQSGVNRLLGMESRDRDIVVNHDDREMGSV